ncbi:MAG: carboxypeptidase regulatory-like domain-containing protein, partial [Acidimicrobiia bacterium]|nr:carboxypeptidase regulatory-like domain-containing protein [Acidimicrobiia bacterium]
LPVEGATISADPTGRSTTTETDGSYSLTLVPGAYSITASAVNYASQSIDLVVAGGRVSANFVLDAASASVDPDTLSATVDYGGTESATVTLANTGTADLEWELLEQQLSATPPVFDAAELLAMRGDTTYKALPRPTTKSVVGEYAFDGPLVTIIDDPDDDTIGTAEITEVRAGVSGDEVAVAIDFSDATPISQTIGVVYLDTDQDPETGLPPEALSGLPTQDIGLDYFVEMFAIHDAVPLVAVWAADFEFVGEAPAEVDGQTISFAIPLEFFGDEDGSMDIALDAGVIGPEDWAPDAGHGSIDPFGDVPWITSDPSSGTLAPGESMDVDVTLGSSATASGTYEGLLALLSNDPRAPRQDIAVSLEVVAPDAFGALAGTVTDSVTGAPIAEASVLLSTQWDGAPLDLTALTDAFGGFHLVGPEGNWPAEIVSDGYLSFAGDLAIVAGIETTHDVMLDPDVALLTLSPDALVVTVAAGGTADTVFTIGNDGTQPLEWLINENLTSVETAATTSPLSGVNWERQDGWAAWDRPEGFAADPIAVGYTDTSVIITDPVGDAIGAVDVTTVEAGVDGATVSMRIDTTAGSPVGDAVGFVFLDTDQDPSTGMPAEDLEGLPEQDIGMEFFLDLFLVPDAGIALLVSTETFEVVAELPVAIDGQALAVDVPLDLLGDDEDGAINIAMVIGDFGGPHDWAPDVGHGELIPFEDIPWLTLSESSGVVDPGNSVEVVVSVDAAGLEPGMYSGELLVSSSDPTVGTIPIPVTLMVE